MVNPNEVFGQPDKAQDSHFQLHPGPLRLHPLQACSQHINPPPSRQACIPVSVRAATLLSIGDLTPWRPLSSFLPFSLQTCLTPASSPVQMSECATSSPFLVTLHGRGPHCSSPEDDSTLRSQDPAFQLWESPDSYLIHPTPDWHGRLFKCSGSLPCRPGHKPLCSSPFSLPFLQEEARFYHPKMPS